MTAEAKKMLTKSRYTKGLQCQKMLWLTVHEPEAEELEVDVALQARFDTGNRVGEVARQYVPGGILIERDQDDLHKAVELTAEALKNKATVLYEAAFIEEEIFCAVDILEKKGKSWTLVEVKSSTKVKEQYLPDVAVQVYVLRKAGLDIKRAEVMVLNRDCFYPDLSNLFVREDVTKDIEPLVKEVAANAKKFLKTVNQDNEPKAKIGDHCTVPYECSFWDRCHGDRPDHHVSTLYYVNEKTAEKLEAQGYRLVSDLDEEAMDLSPLQYRQVKSVQAGKVIVEKGLKKSLEILEGPLAFLDFETVMPAIPSFDGCKPYTQVVAQFSCHVEKGKDHVHHEWIATKAGDPRPEVAKALVAACKGAKTVLAYNASFEMTQVKQLAKVVPTLADELLDINERMIDLLPIVRDHIYHPEFYGSFSLKAVLPALCPHLSYEELEVGDGATATSLLEAVVCGYAKDVSIADLKEYCKLDTWAMVELLKKLRDLAK